MNAVRTYRGVPGPFEVTASIARGPVVATDRSLSILAAILIAGVLLIAIVTLIIAFFCLAVVALVRLAVLRHRHRAARRSMMSTSAFNEEEHHG